ncbi:urease accessory UreF family protein [Catellatospora sp. KI3]|uniref:urease accessory protein UreF n=1 Tax=Catellatospora sp. KI3 TaxID=3041620 RepID=UPI00248237A2|nr:urease accessory UreF family protein [Catellatospora sp. KI3]MDI1461339.1 urease accessory UreF family protein [Catellatospora sp. KI3]
MDTAYLMLSDGRFPSGGHAHSSGLEAAVAAGRVTDLAGVAAFLRGRLHTAGPVTAAFTAAAHHTAALTPSGRLGRVPSTSDNDKKGPFLSLVELDGELEARTVSPALRLASRRQGRALLRAGRATWPSELYAALPQHPDGPHQALTLGVVAAAAGLSAEQAARIAVFHVVTGPASAAVRLLGLDPYQVQRQLALLAPDCDAVAANAAALAYKPPAELPSHSAPLADISAELHATWEVRLFAS